MQRFGQEGGRRNLCLRIDPALPLRRRGGDIRVALRQKIGSATIPQIFVGGEYIGGCTETFDAFNAGRLQRLLEANGVAFDRGKKADAYSFLPKWLHPR